MKGGLLNGLLALVVAALALFVALKPESEPPAYRLSKLRAKDVQRIQLERRGDPEVVIERQASGWRISAPVSARADPFQVERLLGILDATTRHRLPVQDLDRFQLEAPLTRLTIDGETFSYGAVNSVTHEQYVLAGEAVYALAPRYGAMIPANLSQLIRKQVFEESEVPVRLEFRDFTVWKESGAWRVLPAGNAVLSQDDIQRWIDGWRHASALRAEPYSGERPADTFRIALQDGKTLQMHILQSTPELILARADEKIRYHFPAQTGKRLLAPPGAQP